MNNKILKIFAKNVRKFRIDMGLSQEELAKIAGIHRTYIGSIERSERNVSLINIEKISKALGKNPRDLI